MREAGAASRGGHDDGAITAQRPPPKRTAGKGEVLLRAEAAGRRGVPRQPQRRPPDLMHMMRALMDEYMPPMTQKLDANVAETQRLRDDFESMNQRMLRLESVAGGIHSRGPSPLTDPAHDPTPLRRVGSASSMPLPASRSMDTGGGGSGAPTGLDGAAAAASGAADTVAPRASQY
eukprot:gene10508-1535_t